MELKYEILDILEKALRQAEGDMDYFEYYLDNTADKIVELVEKKNESS